jgi:hypothetical protein
MKDHLIFGVADELVLDAQDVEVRRARLRKRRVLVHRGLAVRDHVRVDHLHTESVYNDVLQKSTPSQIRQLTQI